MATGGNGATDPGDLFPWCVAGVVIRRFCRPSSSGWSPQSLTARFAFGEARAADVPTAAPEGPERLYALRQVKQRLHQASFREGVLAAYGDRCAISNLPGIA